MKIKNVNKLYCWALVVAILALWNVITFIDPFAYTTLLWIGYAFTTVAILVQFYVVQLDCFLDDNVMSKFYGLPIAYVDAAYLFFQIVAAILFKELSVNHGIPVPIWLTIVVYSLMLVAAIVGFITTDATRDEMQEDVAVSQNISVMRTMQTKVASLAAMSKDKPAAQELESLAEALRSSDPVSHESLSDIEAELVTCVDALQQAVLENENENEKIIELAQKATLKLIERNEALEVRTKKIKSGGKLKWLDNIF